MRQQKLNIFVFLAAIGFLGILVTQAYWVYSGLKLRQDQFERGVELAMRTTISRLIDYQTTRKLRCMAQGQLCEELGKNIEAAMPPQLLDSLIRSEFELLGLGEGFCYAVFNRPNKRFSMGRYQGYEDQLVNSNYHQSLKPLFLPGDYVLAVCFEREQSRVLGRFGIWVLLSAFFTLSLLFSFWSTVSIVRRQKRLSQIKADFINNMTHELKTPIASINLAAEMLSKPLISGDAGKVMRYAAVVKGESARLQNLVDHVLMSAMLEEGKVRLNRQGGDLKNLVEEVVDNFQHRVHDLSGKLEVEAETGLPTVRFDRLHMTNILTNLLDNAVKYSRGAPAIKVTLRHSGPWVILSVADRGIGIAQEEKMLIFKNLYRSHTGNVHDVKGFGIGLFYVKKIVELHGGKITVESQQGQGSVFEVHLPAVIKTEKNES